MNRVVGRFLPCDLKYKKDDITNNFLKEISKYYNQIGASLAVVHPDLVEDWNVFDNYPAIDWAIENMDRKKTSYKYTKDLKNFFNKYQQWGFVLDVGHCNDNDKAMKLAEDLITELKDKIKKFI